MDFFKILKPLTLKLLQASVLVFGISSAATATPVGDGHVQVKTEGVNQGGEPTQLKIDFVQGEAQVHEFLSQKADEIRASRTQILVSDLGAQELAPHWGAADVQVVDSSRPGASVAFLEIDEKPEERDITPNERARSVVYATVQTGISTYSFMYISQLPLEPALAASAVAAFFNFYFNWDVERWSNFLYRGHKVVGAALARAGRGDWADREWVRETSKAVTGYVGTLAFATVFTGITQWQSWLSAGGANGAELATHAAVSALGSFLLSQPFDNTFGRWLKNGHEIFTRTQVQTMMRFKSLITTAITPLIYAGFEPIYPVAVSFLMSGITLVIYDQSSYMKTNVQLSWSQMRSSLKNFWQEKVKGPICSLLLGKKNGE